MNRADNNNRPHRQDGSDNIAGGYTLGLPSLEVLLGPPSCTAPSKSFTRCESFEAETPLQSLYRSPPSFSGDVLTPPDPLLPSSPVQALAEAGIDENDDAAVFKLLMKQREKRRDAQLLPALPEPARETAVLLDNPLHNDPLGLYFKIASCQLNSASAVPVSEAAESMDDPRYITPSPTLLIIRSRAVLFLESLMTDFCAQLHACPSHSGHLGCWRGRIPRHSLEKDACERDGVRMQILNRKTGVLRELVYPHEPHRTYKQPVLLRMTRILLVASVLYEAILNNCVVTLREIFYRDVALFRRQGIVDGIVDDIVATIGLRRADFHVCAAAKGLIASNALKVNLTNGDSLSISSATPTLIPRGEAIGGLEAANGLDWVLVVEKDAVMQTLCSSRLLDDQRLGPGVLMTGKGFPDLASLQLLRRLADQFPAARIGVLVDADPSGIAILSAYAYGSKANRHSEQHSGLPLGDRIEYLGVKATEWSAVARYEDLLPLSPRDARLAKKMCADLANVNPTWRRELVHMLHLNRKAEIQILSGLLASADDGWPGCRANNDHLMGTTNHLVEFIVAKLNRPHVR